MIHNLDIPIEGLDSQCIGGIWHKSSDDLQPVVSPANEQIITRTALPTIATADQCNCRGSDLPSNGTRI